MSEAEGKVKIEYELEGIDESTSAQERLEAALADVQQVLESSAQTLAEYEQAQAAAAESTDSATAKAVEAGFKMNELRERVGQAVGALGTLSSMFGTESDAGALLGRMNQFGQLGTQVGGIFGPGGAVVGAIAGALIPALDELTGGFDGVSESAERAARAAENASVRILAAARAARQTETSQREADADLARAASDDLRERQRASDDAIAVQRADLEAQFGAISQTARAADGARRDDAIRRLEIVRGRLREIDIEIQEREQQQRTLAFRAENPDGPNTSPRESAGSRRSGGGRQRPEFDEERYLSEFRMGLIDEQEARELARIERIREEEQRSLDMRKEAADIANREAEENARKLLEEQARAAEQQMQREESKRLAIKRDQERDTRMWRGTQESMLDATLGGANAIGGAFADAFGAAIQGQEDFGTAFVKGAKMQLLQFGIGQVAEGAGALLSAVGFLFTNPPAAAGKAAEGAGKIALGVSLGAAGAAISVPAPAAGGEDRAPRMGPSSTEGGGGGNVIVNMNAPSVTAATEAQLGRSLSRTISGSARRFGRAA